MTVLDPASAGMAIEALKSGIGMLRDALGLVKDVKNALPAGEKNEAMQRGLEQAERQIQIAEAQIAHTLGYHLCQCRFPPQIMLSRGYQNYQEIFVCEKCGNKWPPPEIPYNRSAISDYDPYNT